MARMASAKTKVAVAAVVPVPVKAAVITHDVIANRAHEIWEMHGRPHGQSEAHWHQAEGELRVGQKTAK